MAATYLDDIVAAHRAAARADPRDLDELVSRALASSASPRGFARALSRRASAGRLAVVAEIKRRSPSKGPLALDIDPAEVATQYARGGASCISVLTDSAFFGGSSADLVAARQAVSLPVLRKDFTVSPADVADARVMGADAVLLIVAALANDELRALVALADRLGLDALVEIHDEAELARAVDAGASLVGVNQRDLTTFEVDPQRAARVAKHLPRGMLAVAESGIGDGEDGARVAAAGFDAVLVGESLICATDRVAATAALAGLGTSARPGGSARLGGEPGAGLPAAGQRTPSEGSLEAVDPAVVP